MTERIARALQVRAHVDKCAGHADLLRDAIKKKDEDAKERIEAAKARTADPYKDLCICCYEKPITHALYPCGHQSFCGVCASRFVSPGEYRPLCRREAHGYNQIFRS